MADVFNEDNPVLLDGKYNILDKVGQGGAGTVFKVSDYTGDLYALKLLRTDLHRSSSAGSRFVREVESASRIKHPNVIKIYELCQGKGFSYIKMEYIKGGTLEELISEGTLDINIAVEIGIGVLKGLSKVHEANVVHRDLKPANIMVREDWTPVLGDFGIARPLDMTKISRTGTLLGTPQYIAPEQWKGREPTKLTDIYSFGLLLYEMLYGRLPFNSSTDYEYLSKHLYETPEFAGRDIPVYLKKIISRCLEKEPENRYENADEIIVDLVRKSARSRVRKKLTSLFRSPGRRYVIALTVVFLLGAVLHFRFVNRDREVRLVVLPFYNRSGVPVSEYWPQAFQEMIINDINRVEGVNAVNSIDTGRMLEKTESRAVPVISEYLQNNSEADYLVWGNILLKNNRVAVELLIENLDTRYRRFFSYEGTTKAPLFSITDQIVGDVRRTVLQKEPVKAVSVKRMILPELRVHLERGDSYYRKRVWLKALGSYKKLIEVDSNYVKAYILIARCYSKLGKSVLCASYLERAGTIIEKGYSSLKEKLMLQRELAVLSDRDTRKFMNVSEQLFAAYPGDTDVVAGYAESCIISGDYERGIDQLKELGKKSDTGHYRLRIVDCYIYTGRLKKARSIAETLWETEKTAECAEKLAVIAVLEGNCEKGLEYIDKILADKYESACDFYRLRGHLLLLKGRYRDAESSFRTALNRAESEGTLIYGDLASLCLYRGKLRSCIQMLEKGIDAAEARGQEVFRNMLRCRLAELYLSVGKYDSAERICNSLLSEKGLRKYRTRAKFYKAVAMAERGDREQVGAICTELKEDVLDKGDRESGLLSTVLKNRYIDNQYYFSSRILELKTLYDSLPSESYDEAEGENRIMILEYISSIYRQRINMYRKQTEVLKKIQGLSFGRIHYGHVYALSYYYSGCTYHSLRQYDDAVACYRKFLDLWKEGDRDFFPEIYDAELRLKSISNTAAGRR